MKLASKPGETQAFTGATLLFVAVFSFIWLGHDWAYPLIDSKSGGSFSNLMANVRTQFEALHNAKVVGAIIWTGVVTTALTAFTENFAMKKLNAVESTVIYSTEPLLGALFASATLGETIGSNTIVGAALILSGILAQSVDKTALLGAAAAFQVSAMGVTEEVVENIGVNIIELTNSLQEITNSTTLE